MSVVIGMVFYLNTPDAQKKQDAAPGDVVG